MSTPPVEEYNLLYTLLSRPNKATATLSDARLATDEDVKPDISARTLVPLAYNSLSQPKESNKEAAIAHQIELL
jgi:hypothetical protein